ncbi:DUF488 domain-containing protein [Polaromonas jejuensis]|uniref:DUF488 domain-containing protein n=1 Tax=Polaromonas jejuensis TaxID=457502 RepID=A0ABW0QIQ4_9BURK|nr:DUF488 family protein [Polaromonas jejuensis]
MAIKIVRLGTARTAGEGLRIGTVRRPPRGVPKAEFAAQNWYDVWYPNLSPQPDTMKQALAAQKNHDAKAWADFQRKFRAEMRAPEASHSLDLLAALSHSSNFAIGCYCADEAHCHRSLLRELLSERGALIA